MKQPRKTRGSGGDFGELQSTHHVWRGTYCPPSPPPTPAPAIGSQSGVGPRGYQKTVSSFSPSEAINRNFYRKSSSLVEDLRANHNWLVGDPLQPLRPSVITSVQTRTAAGVFQALTTSHHLAGHLT